MKTEGDELVEDAATKQAAQDKATSDYVGAGTDQAEAFANDPKNASGSKPGASEDGRPGGIAGGLARVGSALQGAGKFAGANKKKIGVGGGIAGLLASMVFGFFSLMPLKIESMMKNIYGDHMGKVENALERRAMKTFAKYAIKGGISSDGALVATGSPLADLYRTWKTQGFEKNLAEKYGIKIEQGNKRGTIKITTPQGTQDFTSAEDYDRFLNRDLSRRETRDFVRASLKSETRWNQVIKRHHLRKWMFNAYGVRKWKIFDNKTGKDAETNLDANLQEGAMGEYKTRAGRAIACLFGDASQCPGKSQPGTAESPAAEDGKNSAADVTDAIAEDAKTGTKAGMNDRVSKIITNKALGKAIPVIGWVDLAARLDKLIWDNTIAAIIVDVRKVQYAGVFADWLKISDQIKDGKVVSGDEVNAAMVKLNGSEKSNVSSRIYNNNPDAGEKVSFDDLFDTASTQKSREIYVAATAPNFHWVMVGYLATFGQVFELLGDLISWILDKVPYLNDLLKNIGSFIGEWVMKGFMAVIGPVLTGNETGSALISAIDVGGDVTGNDFAQSVGGEPVSGVVLEQINRRIAQDKLAEDRSKGLFYQLISAENPRSATNRFIALMPSGSSGVITSGAHSMMATITSPINTMGMFFNRIFAISTSPAYAAVTVDPYGIQQYGFTDEQLNRDIDEAGLQAAANWAIASRDPAVKRADNSINISLMLPTDCDLGSATPVVPNLCKLDLVTLQSLKSLYTTEDDGGIGGTGTAVVTPPVGGAGGGGGGVAPSGDVKALAIQMLANKNITYWTNNGVNTRDVVVALSEGKPAYTTCANAPKRTTPQLNPNILKFILEAAGQTNVNVNALTDKCHDSSTSNHYSGEAVDLDLKSGPLSILNPIAAKYGGSKNNETDHHHYDFPRVQ